jgi:hypothetical protein
MKVGKRMQLDLIWTEAVCWEDLPAQIRQQLQELMRKLLWQAANREGVNDE